MLKKIILLSYNPKIRMYFYLSPFPILIIGVLLSAILITTTTLSDSYTTIPILTGVAYLFLWVILMFLRMRYAPKANDLRKREFASVSKTCNNFINEAKKNGWKVEKGLVMPDKSMSFKINGVKNKTKFLLERELLTSSGPTPKYNTAFYIKTNKNKNFEIKPSDLYKKNIKGNVAKSGFINKTNSDLTWLMKTNPFI